MGEGGGGGAEYDMQPAATVSSDPVPILWSIMFQLALCRNLHFILLMWHNMVSVSSILISSFTHARTDVGNSVKAVQLLHRTS